MSAEDVANSPSPSLVSDQLFRISQRGATERVGYHAFIPDPLPPEIPFSIDLYSMIEHASHTVGELSGLGRNLQNPHLLTRPFIRREAVLSSRIEGTQADIQDVFEYEAAERARRPVSGAHIPPDVHEVVNYVRAMTYAVDMVPDRPITLTFTRELHRMLLQGVRGNEKNPGEFRSEQVWIGPSGADVTDARYVPPPHLQVPPLMEGLEAYILDEIDPTPVLVRLAYIHYQFEAIHPFMDGNGRIGRLLIPLLLMRRGRLSQPLLSLSAFFERHRQEYYDHLLAVSQRGAWEEWIRFFLLGVTEQANDAIVRARRLTDLQEKWRRDIPQIGRSGNLMRLGGVLFTSPVLTVAIAADELGVTYQAARNYIRAFCEAGILDELSATHPRQYIARAIEDPI